MNNIVYLDNNATTLISSAAKKVYTQWLSCYNPSSSSKISKTVKRVIESSIDNILAHCGTSTATHTVIFTSGGTESNCFIIRSCVKAYKKKLIEHNSNLRPHIILSLMEHPSILKCVADLVESGELDVSYVSPTIYGNINAKDVEKEIKINTCLITIMYANNEVPVINDIKSIGAIAHEHNIPMHSDCVQIFGKYRIKITNNNIDALSASAHKFYGPKGMGLLIVSNNLISGYNLTGEINGSQQNGLRGGTENVAGIASTDAALKHAFIRRREKNIKLYNMRVHILKKLEEYYPFRKFSDYVNDMDNMDDVELVSLGPPKNKSGYILPNTILLSICKNKGKPFCNIKLKNYLDKNNVIVSIGSACAADDPNASHVLNSIGAPAVVKRGVLRISLGDSTTMRDINKFISVIHKGIENQLGDLKR